MSTIESAKIVKEFGVFIRERRENLGLFQADVATRVGISRGYYAHFENGSRGVDLVMALKICRALGLSIGDFEKLLREDIK
jgi:transcriptional regulator with XRE-family HTH domain